MLTGSKARMQLQRSAEAGEWRRMEAVTRLPGSALCSIHSFGIGNGGDVVQFYLRTVSRI